jgi:hypothetical protein
VLPVNPAPKIGSGLLNLRHGCSRVYVHPVPPWLASECHRETRHMTQALDTEVLVLAGTKDGIYLRRSDAGRQQWCASGPYLAGHDVCHVVREDRDGVLWAAANPRDGAPAFFRSDDQGQTWTRCGELPSCERFWRTDDGGQTRTAPHPVGRPVGDLLKRRAGCEERAPLPSLWERGWGQDRWDWKEAATCSLSTAPRPWSAR